MDGGREEGGKRVTKIGEGSGRGEMIQATKLYSKAYSYHTMNDFFKIPGFEKVPCRDMNFL